MTTSSIRDADSTDKRGKESILRIQDDSIQNLKVYEEFSSFASLGGGGENEETGEAAGRFLPITGSTLIGKIGHDIAFTVIENNRIDVSRATGIQEAMILINGEGGADDNLEMIIPGEDVLLSSEFYVQAGLQTITIKNKEALTIDNIVGDGTTNLITVTIANHERATGDLVEIIGTTNFEAIFAEITVTDANTFTYLLDQVGSAVPENNDIALFGNILTSKGTDIILDPGFIAKFKYSQLDQAYQLLYSASVSAGGGGTSPLTTKGDIFGFSNVNERLPVGSNGQILIVDDTESLGIKWADDTTTLPVIDTTPIVKGSVDATKQLRFEVDGFTTGVTRVITPPNADALLAALNLSQIFTGVNTFSSDVIINADVLGIDRIQLNGGTPSATSVNDVVWYLSAAGDLVSNVNATDGWIWSSGNITKMFLTDALLEKRNVTAPAFQLHNTRVAQTGTVATIAFLANSTNISTGVSMAFILSDTESITGNGTGSMALGVNQDGTLTKFITMNDSADGVVKILTDLNLNSNNITQINKLLFAITGQDIESTVAGLIYDVPTSDFHLFQVNGSSILNLNGSSIEAFKSLDMQGNTIILDADGDTSIDASSDDIITLTSFSSIVAQFGFLGNSFFENLDMNGNNITDLGTLNTHSIPSGTSTFAMLGLAQTFSGLKTFLNTTIGLRNQANTFTGFFTHSGTVNQVWTLPATSQILVGTTLSQTLTNKTIDGDLNTIIDINETQQKVSVGASGTVLTSNGVNSTPTYQSGVSGANRNLSNLLTTSINQNLNPNTNLGQSLGLVGTAWSAVTAQTFNLNNASRFFKSVSNNFEIVTSSGDDIIFRENLTEFFRCDGGNNEIVFERNIRINNENITAFNSTEIGYFVTNFLGSAGDEGSNQIPLKTANISSPTIALLNSAFGSATGCMGIYNAASSSPVFAMKTNSTLWVIMSMSVGTMQILHVTT